MATLNNFDANQVDPSVALDPLPAGKYLAVVSESELKPTKTGGGKYLQLTFQGIDGDGHIWLFSPSHGACLLALVGRVLAHCDTCAELFCNRPCLFCAERSRVFANGVAALHMGRCPIPKEEYASAFRCNLEAKAARIVIPNDYVL